MVEASGLLLKEYGNRTGRFLLRGLSLVEQGDVGVYVVKTKNWV
jgi:hypothetical protein